MLHINVYTFTHCNKEVIHKFNSKDNSAKSSINISGAGSLRAFINNLNPLKHEFLMLCFLKFFS